MITDVSDYRLQLAKSCGVDFAVSTKEMNFGDAIRLVNEGKIQLKPLQSKLFAFENYLDAYKYIEENKEKTMKVLIDVDPED